MRPGVFRLMLGFAFVLAASTLAFAQGGSSTSSLTGVVVDTGGGVIPGATVVVKNNGSGLSLNTVTNNSGAFSVPALDAGDYTITVSLSGFKTAVIKDQRVVAASPASVKVTLEVGNVSQTVEVKGGNELVQTQSAAVSSTLNTDQLKNIPLQTRNALYAVTLLPGVETTGGPRGSTIAGLPQYTINITLDGVNVGNNMQRQTDGFYAMVRPQLDAIEQVTLTTATQGADSAGQGAVQIRFVTRSGTNTYKGTAYDYFRHPWLNTNAYFNKVNKLDKNSVILHQAGGSEGGPIRIPGLFDGRGKGFFFFNYEEFYQPTEATRTRTIFSEPAQTGLFQYNVTTNGVVATTGVNVLALAASNGQLSSMDPTVARLLTQIRQAVSTTGTVTTLTDPNTLRYVYQSPGKGIEHLPTTRVDFNLSPSQRLTGTFYWQEVNRLPDILNGDDARYPGFPNFSNYLSHRTTGSVTLRSTLSARVVNTLVGGFQYSPSFFAANIRGAEQFQNQDGFSLGLNFADSATIMNTSEDRLTPNWNIDDTVDWLKGNHSITFGGSFTQIRHYDTNRSAVPSITFGVQTGQDPAEGLFTTANFPGASNTNLTDARALYATLTGRVTSIGATARLDAVNNKYVYLGDGADQLMFNEVGLFAQDSWKVRPNLTLNLGVRWEYQTPVTPLNGNYSTATLADICGISGVGDGPQERRCNLFQPGNFSGGGIVPQFTQYTTGTKGYRNDYNNFAPNLSAAWRPNVQGGFLRKILGDPDQATIRGGFSIAYNRNGMDEFQAIFQDNPGRTTTGNRNQNLGNLIPAGGSFPLLFRDKANLGPPPTCATGASTLGCIPVSATYPIIATTGNNINIFDPDIQLSYSKSFSVGFQRAVSKDMAVEVRYVGTRNINGWTTENYNEVNVFENGFLNEFKLAQANLQSNLAAGIASFAYRGPGTGTSPLPIYLANLTGTPMVQAGDVTKYTGTNWTNTTIVGRLGQYTPAVANAANDLFSSATFRTNMLTAGLPVNFWIANPAVAQANLRTSGSFTKSDQLQLELRRRLSRGLTVSGNYTYAGRYGSTFDSLHFDRYLLQASAVPHAFKFNTSYELPFGRGKRYGTNMNKWLDAAAGNWLFSMAGRWQTTVLSIGSNRRLVGMSVKDLENMYSFRKDSATGVISTLPAEVILNTRRAFSTSATSLTGYGSLGVPEGQYIAPASTPGCVFQYAGDCNSPKAWFIHGPMFARFDMTLRKSIPFGTRKSFDVQVDMLNVFDNINFTWPFNPGTGSTIFNVTSAYSDLSNSYNPGGRIGQIVWRINW